MLSSHIRKDILKVKQIILNDLDESIEYASNSLKDGNIGIFPTDTVYGIGCDSLNQDSINKLYIAKKRNLNNPINILISDVNMLKNFVLSINEIEKQLINKFWPGELTIVFDKSSNVPNILTSNLPTIGVRMPNNKICLKLINKFGSAIATSSANISNKDPYTSINSELIKDFKNSVQFIINSGTLCTGIPSTIVRVEGNDIKILRKGSISESDILRCFWR